jgi:hypothetical protein
MFRPSRIHLLTQIDRSQQSAAMQHTLFLLRRACGRSVDFAELLVHSQQKNL